MLLRVFVISCLIGCVVCPPPNRQPPPAAPADNSVNNNADSNNNNDQQQPDGSPVYKFPYSEYLEAVVKILEAQPQFQENIRQMSEDDIKSGKIADHIGGLDENVFKELTNVKIKELKRMEEVFAREGSNSEFANYQHLDLDNLEKFSKEDLRKLIVQTVADMNKLDEQRREQFKEYEMQKKAEEDHKLAQMQADEREKVQREMEEAKRRHKEHEAMKHPGGREQLEEVWEEGDKMDKGSFDPKTFFMLHDLDGDNKWNHEEIEALFQKELEKVYNESNPDDDIRERVEEMHRMREHVVKQMDKDNDGFISLDEFLQDPEAQVDDNKDEGWDDLSNQKIYTDEELKRFEEEYAKKQGWGEHAYDGVQTLSPHSSTQSQQQQQQQFQQQQNQQQPIQPPPPPPAQQQYQQPPPQQPQANPPVHNAV